MSQRIPKFNWIDDETPVTLPMTPIETPHFDDGMRSMQERLANLEASDKARGMVMDIGMEDMRKRIADIENSRTGTNGNGQAMFQPFVIVPFVGSYTDRIPEAENEYEDEYEDFDMTGEDESLSETGLRTRRVRKSKRNGESDAAAQSDIEPRTKGDSAKRPAAFVFAMIFSLLIVAVAVIGAFVPAIADYVSIYNCKSGEEVVAIQALDPLVSFLKSALNLDLGGALPAKFGELFPFDFKAEHTAAEMIAPIVLPAGLTLYVIFALAALVASIVGLAKPASSKGRVKLGFLSIVMFLLALATTVAGIVCGGKGLGELVDCITMKGDFAVGYGTFAFIALPIATFICACCFYKKGKREKKNNK